MVKSVAIPLERVRLRIISNPKKLDMRALWKQYGGENKILVNGPFFNMSTYKPLVHLKIGGKVIYQPVEHGVPTGEWGFAWNDGEPPVWCVLPNSAYQNYITNTVVIPKDGVPRKELTSHLDADGTKAKPRFTSRPAWGLKKGNFMLYVTSNLVSLWGLQKILVDSKWENALVGDGGGSTAYKDGSTEIYTSRKIPYWLLIEIVDNEPKGDKPEMHGITVKAYSVAKDARTRLSPNFMAKEFACNDGTDTYFVAPELVDILQKVRTHFGKPVYIASAYRTPAKNKAVGGAEYSQHLYGTAADITVSKGKTQVDPKIVAAYLETLLPKSGGIGIYSTFTHVDVRAEKARWNG